ncbi:MAG: ABC transporter substrate-binding protein [Candidatus Vogelbacteria bacterium]|nr:ABC transporter substrate-binding protein [Candidatus Vogelbacteria bacterium]
MNNKIIVWAVVILVILGGVWWRSRGPAVPAENEPIKIGAVLSLTGPAAPHGENEKMGIDLAVREINNAGGVLGRPLKIIYEDDQTNPVQTVNSVTKLITIDKAEVIIGGTWDFLINAAAPVIEKEKKVLITPSALPDTIEKPNDYIFSVHSPVAVHAPAVEKFLSQFNDGRIVTIVQDNPWGLAHQKVFKQAVEKTGNLLIKEIVLPKADNNDIQGELTRVKLLNPDAILVASNFSDVTNLLKRRIELKLPAKVLIEQKVIEMYNNGQLSADMLNGVVTFRFADPDLSFTRNFQDFYGRFPGQYSDTAYDAVYLIKKSIEYSDRIEAGSIQSGLKKITDHQGASGWIDFSVNNYPENKSSILEVLKGSKFIEYQ